MTFLDELFRFYGFKELVELIINKVGFASLIVLLGAYFAAIVYFAALPSKSRFSADFSRVNAVVFFQQAFYSFSFVIFLMPFLSGWGSFFLVVILYGILVVPMFVNIYVFRRDFSFDDYVRFRGGFTSMTHEYIGVGLSWLTVLAESLAFFYFDPAIPLVGWAIICYCLAVTFLLSAYTQGILWNASSCVYAKIVTDDGLVEGFIIAKGSDHYLVKTKESDMLLSSAFVKSISPLPLPK